MSKEAMKLALEALKQIDEAMPFPVAKLAQAALREALAEQPAQQEPVAVVSGYYGGQCVILPIDPARIFNSNTVLYTSPPPCPTCEALVRTVMLDQTSHDAQRKPQQDPFIYYRHYDGGTQDFPDEKTIPLYTSPPAQRKPLTMKEIREWWAGENGLEDCRMSKLDDFEKVVRAIEAAHGIKE